MSSRGGFQWTPAAGLKGGLPCEGAIAPSKLPSTQTSYDIIVVGAGFAGLVASRDLALRGTWCSPPQALQSDSLRIPIYIGHKVLLLDSRDRIGGRAWTSVVDGYPYELGAAWFHWNQPNALSQISRYGLMNELKLSFDLSGGIDKSNLNYEETGQSPVAAEVSHDDEDSMYGRLGELYFNVDGAMGGKLMPFPSLPFYNSEILKFDKLTALDRIEQIRDQLTDLEINALKSYLLVLSGGTIENTGFLDLFHWWMLCNQQPTYVSDQPEGFKLRRGTSAFAQRIFDDGVRSGNLDILLSHPVKKINDAEGRVSVISSKGSTFTASRVISTIPLNVLQTVEFSPPLSSAKMSAIKSGHIGLHTKVHFEASGTGLRTWSGYSYPGRSLLYAYGDETTPSNNTHVVAFGASTDILHRQDNVEAIQKALLHLRSDIKIERILFHDWVKDPSSRGSWCMYPKDFATKYLGALQERHGNVWFASADWADGWRGFVDGAIEQGTRVAQSVADSVTATE